MSNDKFLIWELWNKEAGCGKKVNLLYCADVLGPFYYLLILIKVHRISSQNNYKDIVNWFSDKRMVNKRSVRHVYVYSQQMQISFQIKYYPLTSFSPTKISCFFLKKSYQL